MQTLFDQPPRADATQNPISACPPPFGKTLEAAPICTTCACEIEGDPAHVNERPDHCTLPPIWLPVCQNDDCITQLEQEVAEGIEASAETERDERRMR